MQLVNVGKQLLMLCTAAPSPLAALEALEANVQLVTPGLQLLLLYIAPPYFAEFLVKVQLIIRGWLLL